MQISVAPLPGGRADRRSAQLQLVGLAEERDAERMVRLSLADDEGAWSGFARGTVVDWLHLLAGERQRAPETDVTEQTLTLAVLRGALLDLLATGDTDRTTRAVELYLARLAAPAG